MPEVTVACPHCQQPIRVMSEHAGAQVACPLCENAMVVPQFEPQPASPQIVQQQADAAAAAKISRQQSAAELASRAVAAGVQPVSDVHAFGCSHCSQPFQVSSASLGQAVQCPSCGQAVRLPNPGTPPPDPPSKTPTLPVVSTKPSKSRESSKPTLPKKPVLDSKPKASKKPKANKTTRSAPAVAPSDAATDPKAPTKPSSSSNQTKDKKAKRREGPNRPEEKPPEKPIQNEKRKKRAVNPANTPVPLSLAGGATQPILARDGQMGTMDAARLLPPKFIAMLPRMADIALSADGQAVASMSFQEPVKTIFVNGQERVLRRLSPEEKVFRRRQRNVVVFVCGVLFLLVAGALLIR